MKKEIKIVPLSILTILLITCIIIARTAIGNAFCGRVHFPKEYVGEVLKLEDGQEFTVFRRLKVINKGDNPNRLAVFKVRFKFKNLKPRANKRLSMIPAPFLMGMRGFREKYWTINENTDYFQGIYQWESREMAERYPGSFIFKLMTKRSAPGTLSYEIIPNTNLSQYIEKHVDKDLLL